MSSSHPAGAGTFISIRTRAVVAVLHDPNLAFLYGDRFIFLKDGQAETWHSSQKPWDPEILTRVYCARVSSIPYRDRALVIPGFEL